MIRFLFALISAIPLITAHAENLAGTYYHERRCGEPTGCGELILTEDHQAITAGFGYIIVGKWHNTNNQLVIDWYHPPEPVYLVGQFNPKIKGVTVKFDSLINNLNGGGALYQANPNGTDHNTQWIDITNDNFNCSSGSYSQHYSELKNLSIWTPERHWANTKPTAYHFKLRPEWNQYEMIYDRYFDDTYQPAIFNLKNGKLYAVRDAYESSENPLVKGSNDTDKELMTDLSMANRIHRENNPELLKTIPEKHDQREMVEYFLAQIKGPQNAIFPQSSSMLKPTDIAKGSLFHSECDTKEVN